MKIRKALLITILVGFSTSIFAQCVQCDEHEAQLGTNASRLGTETNAAGYSAFASGYNADASGAYSTAIGRDISVTANNSFIIGNGFSSSAILTNNIAKSIMLGVNSSTPSLTIRQKTTQDVAAYVGIGTTNPMKEFHVNGNVMISGSGKALLFATSATSSTGNFGIKLTTDGLNFFVPNSGMPTKNSIDNLLYIKNDGNIGVGTSLPKQMLHVVGGNILISRVANRNDRAPGSTNGSILFGDVTSTQYPFGSWGIEYLNDSENGHGLNFWKTADANGASINYVLFLCEEGSYKGNVGIGTKTPSCKLEVSGSAKTTSLQTGTLNVTGNVSFRNLAGNTTKVITIDNNGDLLTEEFSSFHDNMGNHVASQNLNLNGNKLVNGSSGTGGIYIHTNGNVRIGAGNMIPTKALEVNGTIRSKEVIVEVANWSDFVFDNNYNLMSLKDTESYIKQNGHLPNIPSAAEVEKEGIQLGEMNALLLQKVEELTLYVIELQKQIDELKGDN